MYYLQSRYYDPEVGRFLNADAFAATGQGVLGNNMFVYCRNNPVSRIDVSGTADSIAYNDGELLSNDELDSRSGGGGGAIYNQSFKCCQSSGNAGLSNSDCNRVGGGHGNPIHKQIINAKMDELVASGEYVAVYGNRALSTAHQNGSWQPDITAIKNDGSVEVWECASPSQATGTRGYWQLNAKIHAMQTANPHIYFHPIIPWEAWHD